MFFAAFAALVSPAFAQSTDDAVTSPVVRAEVDNVTRVESWSFFQPVRADADADYTLVSNRARLSVAVEARRIAFEGSFQYAQLFGLPRDAFGPGPFGPGASYFAASRTPEAFQLYFKSMSVTFKEIAPRLSLRVGRMPYSSDEETVHAGRLIGNAEWSVFERAFDGARADYRHDRWRWRGAFLMPTQGVFEESASPTIGRLQIATTDLSSGPARLFVHNYRDRRAVSARPDNTGIQVERADIHVQAIGASTTIAGVQLWGAWQRGDWYGQPHRAFSISAEAGYTWSRESWRPRVSGGAVYASGDRDPNDGRHGTFFPMLATTRPPMLRGTFAQMNLRDIYAAAVLRPHSRLRLDSVLHVLTLANRQDRWYSGTGATAFAGDYFGFSSRASTLRTDLGTVLELSAAADLRPHWTLTASSAYMRGGDVVRRQFAGRTLWMMTLESALSLPW